MITLKISLLIIICIILLSIYLLSVRECNKGNWNKPVPVWMIVTVFSCFVLGVILIKLKDL